MTIYKYVIPERIDVLKNQKIRFSQIEALNDPFEINPSINLFRHTAQEKLKSFFSKNNEFVQLSTIEQGKIISDLVNERFKEILSFLRDLLTLSLTRRNNNLLMWSHYTNSHQGFVIGFDEDHSYFHKRASIFQTSELTDVVYSEKRPLLPMFELPLVMYEAAPELFSSKIRDYKPEEFIKILITKSIDWQYEEEVRLFTLRNPDNIAFNVNGLDVYLYDFPTDAVTEIVFGHAIQKQLKSDISKIVQVKYPRSQLYEATLSSQYFDLKIISARV